MRGLLLAGAIGYVVGILTAPKRGSELRVELKERLGDLQDKGQEFLANPDFTQLRDEAMHLQEKAKESFCDAKERTASYVEGAQTRATEIVDMASDKVRNLKEKAIDLKGQGIQKIDQVKDKALEMKDKAMELKDQALEFRGQATAAISDNREKLTQTYLQAKERAAETMEQAKETLDKAKQAASETLSDVKEDVGQLKNDVKNFAPPQQGQMQSQG